MGENKGYKKLKVWEKAHAFAIEIYRESRTFPKEELYGVTSQLRRAALSVALNIVEGQASSSKREFINFLNIENRSLVVTDYLMEVAKELGLINNMVYQKLETMREEIGMLLHGFMKGISSKL